jgi:hypothetical protein
MCDPGPGDHAGVPFEYDHCCFPCCCLILLSLRSDPPCCLSLFLCPCSAITDNTRASYPIEYIDNARLPCVGPHARNVVLLCCDAFGVLPPVSRLNLDQAMYHFISGYTSKVGKGRGGGGSVGTSRTQGESWGGAAKSVEDSAAIQAY